MAETKQCKQCQKEFEIADKDLAFYKKVSPAFADKTYEVPAPTLCPVDRSRERQSYRNVRLLHKRKCNATGETIYSIFPENAPFPLDKSAAETLGAKWQDNDYSLKYDGPFYEPKGNIEDYIENEDERNKLLSGILKCEVSGKPFKIVPQELAFYFETTYALDRSEKIYCETCYQKTII